MRGALTTSNPMYHPATSIIILSTALPNPVYHLQLLMYHLQLLMYLLQMLMYHLTGCISLLHCNPQMGSSDCTMVSACFILPPPLSYKNI